MSRHTQTDAYMLAAVVAGIFIRASFLFGALGLLLYLFGRYA